jgi:hypothetical protein
MSRQELEPWVMEELSQADFGDQRLTKRAMRLVSDLAARPEASVPQACADAAATKGAYRFWDHEQVTPEAIRAAHCAKTVERVQAHRTILALQDTTTLNLDSHPKTEGLGPIDAHGTQGMQVHSVLAVSGEGVPLGLLYQQVWARDPQQRGKKHKRKQVPIEEKESYRWRHEPDRHRAGRRSRHARHHGRRPGSRYLRSVCPAASGTHGFAHSGGL